VIFPYHSFSDRIITLKVAMKKEEIIKKKKKKVRLMERAMRGKLLENC
jgi:hypothetical protein